MEIKDNFSKKLTSLVKLLILQKQLPKFAMGMSKGDMEVIYYLILRILKNWKSK